MEQPEITGYRQLSADDARRMNAIKDVAMLAGRIVEDMKAHGDAFDQRWVAIGATDLQRGFMELVRAVAKPTTF